MTRRRDLIEKQLTKCKSDLDSKKQELSDAKKEIGDLRTSFEDHQEECAKKVLGLQDSLAASLQEVETCKASIGAMEAEKKSKAGQSGCEVASLQATIAELKSSLESKEIQESQLVQAAVDRVAVVMVGFTHSRLSSTKSSPSKKKSSRKKSNRFLIYVSNLIPSRLLPFQNPFRRSLQWYSDCFSHCFMK